MIKELTVTDSEKLGHLADEIKAIVGEARERATIEMVAAKHMIGQAIVESPLYKKNAKSQGELYSAIEDLIGVKHTTLSDCVWFYEQYSGSDARKLAGDLYEEHGSWRNIRALRNGVSTTGANNEPQCKHCPKHCP